MKVKAYNPEEILKLGSLEAAPLLLGCLLFRKTAQGTLSLEIVETEAYHQDDPASHTYRGLTTRTAPMFEAGGVLYVYFTYGMHYCINIVVGNKGVGEAVLIRAGRPVAGIEIMKNNRRSENIYNLASGPGKLTQALGITNTNLSGKKLTKFGIWLETPKKPLPSDQIMASPRIGITKAADVDWRFYIKENPFVSSRNTK